MKAWTGKKKLTSAEQKAFDIEIKRQMAEYDKKHIREIEALILWVLHEQYGFGKKRLKRFYDSFDMEIAALLERYVMNENDDVWLCTRKLKDAGIDISEWSKED